MGERGFHDGELAVQARAGVRAQAARLGGAMLAVPDLNGGIGSFLADRDFAVITARDAVGRLWISPLFASPGFLLAFDRTLRVNTAPGRDDPLHGLPSGQPVGMLAIEFATRRRARINGYLTNTDDQGFELFVDQAFGNCPRYIQQRHLEHAERGTAGHVERSDHLSAEQVALITHADTFFLGTVHPTCGADASHRGGPPGFVRVEDGALWWPDYSGNNMFNSFGNLESDPTASLLFIDFDTGTRLHVSGTAAVEWTAPNIHGDDGGVGRRVRFNVDSTVSITDSAVHSDAPQPSPHNPPLT
jgi:predicted pyridoxine 5'-phosphate oxidase superfamily flavin-nucleotide-binding protein